MCMKIATLSQDMSDEINAACTALYHDHHRWLLAFAIQRGCDEHEASDLIQELFLRVFRLGMIGVLSRRPPAARRAWLQRTLRWMLMNHHRHRTRLRRGGSLAPESLEVLLAEGNDVPGGCPPDEQHDRRWAMRVIERGIQNVRASIKPSLWPLLESSLCGDGGSLTGSQRVAAHRARVRLREEIRAEARYHELLCATTRVG